MKGKNLKIALAGFLLVGALTAFGPGEKYFEIAKNLDIFATLFQEVNKYYVDEVSPTDLMKTGIDAMLGTLDPYTNYIPEDRIEDFRTITTGEYGGIGAVVGTRNGKMSILMPHEGYPAHKAGLQIGDQIIRIDDVEVTERNLEEVSRLLKGQASTDLMLTIKRYGVDEPIKVPIKRETIKLENVPYYGMVNKEIGIIQLTDFTRDASKEVKTALLKLKEQGATKIIIDLRGNPGGLLNEAINISNIFIPKGEEVVSTKGKIESWNRSHKALNASVDTEIPIAVLISGTSASASEIVSGVIQDYDRGILIGQRSFGKGLVQATRSLTYNSKLKVTVAKYYIPSGRCIQEIDYSATDEDGRPAKFPDSLRVAFKTKNGRTVYDGGGVAPDIEVKLAETPAILVSMINKGLIFDYGTVYRHKNAQIADALSYKVSDAEFNDFVQWLSDKDYDYKTGTELLLDKLVERAERESRTDDIQGEVAALKAKLAHDKLKDLQKYKASIVAALEREIVTRYYFEKGQIEASFDSDPDIQAAVSALSDKARYEQLLKGQ